MISQKAIMSIRKIKTDQLRVSKQHSIQIFKLIVTMQTIRISRTIFHLILSIWFIYKKRVKKILVYQRLDLFLNQRKYYYEMMCLKSQILKLRIIINNSLIEMHYFLLSHINEKFIQNSFINDKVQITFSIQRTD